MRIGIVIPTIGRDTLAKTLAPLIGQPYDQLTVVQDFWGNVSKARNLGWQSLDVDIIAFVDDDTIPAKDFVIKGREYFEKTGHDFMQGNVHGGLNTSEDFFFVTANFWVKKSALVTLNGFDEGFLRGGGHEDVDLGWRLLDQGMKGDFGNECKVYHPKKPQHGDSGHNIRRLMSKHPDRWNKFATKGIIR